MKILPALSSRTTRWKSARLHGGVLSNSYPFHYRTAFAFSSILCPPFHQCSLRTHLPSLEGGMSGLPCFVQVTWMIKSLLLHRQSYIRVPQSKGWGNRLHTFWLEPVSIFGSLLMTMSVAVHFC